MGGESRPGCGGKGMNTWSGKTVGAYCCNGPMPCVVSFYSQNYLSGILLMSYSFKKNTGNRIWPRHWRFTGTAIEQLVKSVRLSNQCAAVKLVDEDECKVWVSDNMVIHHSVNSLPMDLRYDICGITVTLKDVSVNKLGRPVAPQNEEEYFEHRVNKGHADRVAEIQSATIDDTNPVDS